MFVEVTAQPEYLKDGSKNPNAGLVITPSTKNPEYGTISVKETHKSMEGNFLNIQNRVAFIRGKLTDLSSLGLKEGQKISGKIIRRESFEPFYEGQLPKVNPNTGEIVLKNSKPVYMEQVYTANTDAHDEWVGANNTQVAEQVAQALTEQAV